jgi:hypothetical protein
MPAYLHSLGSAPGSFHVSTWHKAGGVERTSRPSAIEGTTDMRPRLNLTDFLDFALSFLSASTPSRYGVDRWYRGGLLVIFEGVRGTDQWGQGDR